MMEYLLRDCGRGLHRRIFLVIFGRRFHLLEKRVKLAHRKARNESSYRSCKEAPAGIGFRIDPHVRLPAAISGATLATSDKNNSATRCTSNRSTSWQPADESELQRDGSR